VLNFYRRKSYDLYEPREDTRFKKIIKLSAVITIILALFIINLNTYYELKTARDYVSNMESVYFKQTQSLNELNASIPTLQDSYYEENLYKLLTEEEILSLAKQNWQYKLYVNDIEITGEPISIRESYVYITLTETKINSKPLPKNHAGLGSLGSLDSSKKFYDYLVQDDSFTYEVFIEPEGSTTYAYYDYTGIAKGETFTLKVNPQLMERLQLTNPVIEVTID
jgi:hypothetical protein